MRPCGEAMRLVIFVFLGTLLATPARATVGPPCQTYYPFSKSLPAFVREYFESTHDAVVRECRPDSYEAIERVRKIGRVCEAHQFQLNLITAKGKANRLERGEWTGTLRVVASDKCPEIDFDGYAQTNVTTERFEQISDLWSGATSSASAFERATMKVPVPSRDSDVYKATLAQVRTGRGRVLRLTQVLEPPQAGWPADAYAVEFELPFHDGRLGGQLEVECPTGSGCTIIDLSPGPIP
jgi:hypothetical protein